MSSTNQAKRGTKRQHWTDSRTGDLVEGLTKQKDGRWRILGTNTKFTEANEQDAIKRYRQLTAQIVTVIRGNSPKNWEPTDWTVNPIAFKTYLDNLTEKNDQPFWDRVIWELTNRKEYAAKKTGFEQIAYLTNLRPPEPSQSVDSLKKTWEENAPCTTQNSIGKVTKAWKEFTSFTGIKTLDDITPQICVKYADHVHKTVPSGKTQQHLFNGARRILTFSMKRAISVKACAAALESMRLMGPNKSTKNKKPKPISVADFKAILEAANGDDKAMVLMMLNCCLYAGEVVRCQWSDIDFELNTFVSRRKKKGEFIRVACLWPETLEALKAVSRKTSYIFLATGGAAKGKPLRKSGAFLRMAELAGLAQCPKVKPSHFRDGAFTAAVKGNVTGDLVRIYAGQSNGTPDNYVLSNPSMVKPACDAVYKTYFGDSVEKERADHIAALKVLGLNVKDLVVESNANN